MVSFIVPVRNDAARLQRCLVSIARNGTAGLSEILVVDNGSTDDSVAVARAAGAKVIVVPEGRVARLRNEGSIEAKTVAVQLIPAGAMRRIDAAGNPNCLF